MDVPEGAGGTAPARGKLRLNFRSWVEDYRRPEPPIDRAAVAAAMQKRGIAKRQAAIRSSKTPRMNGGRQDVMCARRDLAEAEAAVRRRGDPIELVRTFLQRRGDSVFRADVIGGARTRWIVNGRRPSLSDQELLDLAIRRGFTPSMEGNSNG